MNISGERSHVDRLIITSSFILNSLEIYVNLHCNASEDWEFPNRQRKRGNCENAPSSLPKFPNKYRTRTQ
jgi:hypothetical protein